MRLDQVLVQRNLCESREEAKECIEKGYVLLNGVIETKKTRQIDNSSIIILTGKRKFVSRGGNKLEGAFMHIYKNEESIRSHIEDKKALDVGSSTGGFTDCLLLYGVDTVTAVDVGSNQFHTKLQDNSRVTLFENTDIRNFPQDQTFDYIVADLSFISLEKVIDTIFHFTHEGTELFLLIKPQFEVGKGNTKKGIVKDKILVDKVLTKYTSIFIEKNLYNIEIFLCTIEGGDGNQEYFIYGKL